MIRKTRAENKSIGLLWQLDIQKMELFQWGSFQCKSKCKAFFQSEWITQEISTFVKSYPIILSGWQNSETEAVSVSYCCKTNNLKT